MENFGLLVQHPNTLFRFSMQSVAYFVGCGSNDSVIFRAFAVSFGLRDLSGTAEAPTGPCWGCLRTGLAHGCLVVEEGELRPPAGRRLPRLGCLFRWDPLFRVPRECARGRAVAGPPA